MMGSYVGKKGTWECDWPTCTADSDRKFKDSLRTWYAGMAFCHNHLEAIHKGAVPPPKPPMPINIDIADWGVINSRSDPMPKKNKKNRFPISLTLAWYDFWIGFYWDKTKKRLYILPIPCIGVCLQF